MRKEVAEQVEEFSEWAQWTKTNLTAGGFDLPSEETRVLFAATSVHFAERVRGIVKHLPLSVRTRIIEAAILHQCWLRQVALRKKHHLPTMHDSMLSTVIALDFVQKRGSDHIIEGSDGHRYRLRLPGHGTDGRLATSLLCMELAKAMGLPVRPASFVTLARPLATRIGILRNCGETCRSKGLRCPTDNSFCCLGIREVEELQIGQNCKPELPMSTRAARLLAGEAVFNILTLNQIPEDLAFVNVAGRAEPIFGNYEHCCMDADWSRFIAAGSREPVNQIPYANNIRSYEHLDSWIKHVEQVDLESICELVFKMPAQWYGNSSMLLASVAKKLDERRSDLRGIIHHFVKIGYFTGLRKVTVRANRIAYGRVAS